VESKIVPRAQRGAGTPPLGANRGALPPRSPADRSAILSDTRELLRDWLK
jgi:hypothetical protein